MTKRVQYKVRVTTPTGEVTFKPQLSLGYARTAAEMALDHHPGPETRIVILKGWDHSFVLHEVVQEGLRKEYVSQKLSVRLRRGKDGKWGIFHKDTNELLVGDLGPEQIVPAVKYPDNGFIPVDAYFTYR
jgi:hypothetical protein